MVPRARLLRLIALLMLAAAPVKVASAAGHSAPRAILERRLDQLADLRKQSMRDASVPLASLHDQLLLLADSLLASHEDSMASRAFHIAGSISERIAPAHQAEVELRRAIALAVKSRALPEEAGARRTLAMHVLRSSPEDAIRMQEALRPLYERLHDLEGLATINVDISKGYGSLGRLNDAFRAGAEGVRTALLSGVPVTISYALSSQSQHLHLLHRETEALELADSALGVSRRNNLLQTTSMALLARSNALRSLGRPQEALAALEEAYKIDLKRKDRHRVVLGAMLQANLLFEQKKFLPCLDLLDVATSEARATSDSLNEFRSQTLRAAALVALKRYGAADTLLGALVPRYEALRDRQDSEQSQAGVFLRGGELYSTMSRLKLETGRVAEAWQWVERGRAGLLEARLGAAGVGLEEIQKQLAGSGAALIQYNDPQRNPLTVFVITADSIRARVLGSSVGGQDAITAYSQLSTGSSDEDCRPVLERLGTALLAGVGELIPAGTRRLYLVPPSDLMGLPFEALPLGAERGAATLGERYAVSYLPSAQVLPRLEQKAPPARGMMVFADPELPVHRSGWELPFDFRPFLGIRLPGARQEAKNVAVPGALVLTGRNASKARLMGRETPSMGVLHFATHAVFRASAPESAGILLAGKDGLVRAPEVERLGLHADLVTLSGCHTAGGEDFLGEGTFGLPRSFLIAGARSVVTSLWDVEDRAASRFMTLFYQGLKSGQPRDESLRAARAQMAREGFKHRDRSAFVLTGVGDQPVAAVSAPARAAHR